MPTTAKSSVLRSWPRTSTGRGRAALPRSGRLSGIGVSSQNGAAQRERCGMIARFAAAAAADDAIPKPSRAQDGVAASETTQRQEGHNSGRRPCRDCLNRVHSATASIRSPRSCLHGWVISEPAANEVAGAMVAPCYGPASARAGAPSQRNLETHMQPLRNMTPNTIPALPGNDPGLLRSARPASMKGAI